MTTDAIEAPASTQDHKATGPARAGVGRLSGEDLYVAAVVAVGAAGWILTALALLSARTAR